MAYELIKVSELPELTTPSDPNVLPIQDGDYLKRISFENLKDAAVGDMEGSLAAAYDSTAAYAVGDYCIYEGQLYRCTTAITTAEAWTAGHWTAAVLTDDIASGLSAEASTRSTNDNALAADIAKALGDLAAVYSTSATYAVGDYCIYQGQLYRCTTAITTAEAWTAAHWSAVALADDTRDLRSAISDIGEIVGIRNVNFTEIDGSFITANGGISDSPTFSRSAPVSVSKGDVVKFNARGYNTTVAMISLVNDDGTNIRPQAISVDSTVRLYTFTVPVDGYIAVSYNKNYEHTLIIESNKIDALEDATETIMITEEVTPSNLRNGYIHRDGRFMEANNFRCTNPIRLENETITFTARGYLNTVSLICLCDENGENRINLVNSTEENPQQNITYTSNGVTYVIISSSLTIPIKYKSVKLKQPVDDPYISLSMFEKFGVVGDSYASGALFFNGQEKDDYAHSWGQIMARRLGTTCTNYSRGGLTTRTWLTDSKGLSLLLNSDAEDIYYLVLGINDYISLGSSYLGSIEDITSHSSYTDYADSFYGNYGRIIEQIKAHAPNAKIVMFTMSLFSTTSVKEAFNNAIKEIANHYGLPYINQDDDLFFTSVFFNSTKVEGHPIAITYSGMACAFERLLCDCIKNNVAYFKNTFWYA